MHPKEISIESYNYDLPAEKIAHYPLANRDNSKLLVYKNGETVDSNFTQLSSHLPEGALLIFNNSKVIEARIAFTKKEGAQIEIFCLSPSGGGSMADTLLQKGKASWLCMVGNAAKWKDGKPLEKTINSEIGEITLSAHCASKTENGFLVDFSWLPAHLTFQEAIHAAGAIPLPPYIKRKAETIDQERYQTIYANNAGSVAAPTAGLHFTEKTFSQLAGKNIQHIPITLHVGAGTFLPVKASQMDGHTMHAEVFEIGLAEMQTIAHHLSKTIVTVGTTSTRCMESLYCLGCRLIQSGSLVEPLTISQWEPYDSACEIEPSAALAALIQWMKAKEKLTLQCATQILIAPPYKLKMSQAIITNFHQPKSTLLLLIASVIGDDWEKVYAHALENEYRFLSYGDSSLLWIS